MNNMYDILQRFNTVAASQLLNEGRAVKEDDVEEGNRFTGELAKARAAGKKEADLDGDGDMEPVKEAKKAKPDFLDVDRDGDRKEPFKKAVSDKKKSKKPVKESLRLIKEASLGDRMIQVYHDREYQEYHVCIAEGDQVLSRQFAGSSREATALVRGIISEARGMKIAWPGSPEYKEKFGQDRETFRKKHAPSIMKDPESRAELDQLDTEYEAGKKRYGRDDDDSDDEEEGDKKARPAGEKRGRGRPKKYTADRPRQERVTAKSRKADRTAWTPDRKKKKVKEQDISEQTTASPARVVANAISQAIQRDYAGQGFSWSGDQYDFEEFLGDQYADEAFVDDYHGLSDRARGSVMRAVVKAAREHFSGQDDVVDARGRGLMKGMREEQGTSEGSTGSDKRDSFPNYKGPRDEYGDPDDGSMYDPRSQKQREQDREKWDDRHHDDLRRGGMREDYDRDEYDEEGEMAKSQARVIADAAEELESMLTADENLPEWVQKKITLAQEYIDSARDYLKSNRPEEQDMDESALQAHIGKKKYGKEGMAALQQAGREGASKAKMDRIRAQHDKLDEEDLEEKAVSRAQRAAAGIAHAAKKGEIPRSELRGASKEMAKMPAGELEKFAKTKEKGLPEKVKEVDTGEADARKTVPASKDQQEKIFAQHRERTAKEKQDHEKEKPVKETTTAGSVATAPAEGEKKSKGGIQFGKGVYEAKLAESFDAELDRVVAEGTTITINSPDSGEASVSINGTGEDAMALGQLLKMAGLFSASGYQSSCATCGQMHEGECSVMEEDLANSADNTETMSTDYMVNGLSGGLNGPKLQVNPNNMADNPLAMKDLGKGPSGQVNLGAIAEQVELEDQQRMLDLYRKIAS
jgi:hypothetical protein